MLYTTHISYNKCKKYSTVCNSDTGPTSHPSTSHN